MGRGRDRDRDRVRVRVRVRTSDNRASTNVLRQLLKLWHRLGLPYTAMVRCTLPHGMDTALRVRGRVKVRVRVRVKVRVKVRVRVRVRVRVSYFTRQWLDCTPPHVITVSHSSPNSSAKMYSSFLILLPPNSEPVRSSRLMESVVPDDREGVCVCVCGCGLL
jgi:hypothetical protein